jgi:uncharacterized repeat protein (TIGR02543 family)
LIILSNGDYAVKSLFNSPFWCKFFTFILSVAAACSVGLLFRCANSFEIPKLVNFKITADAPVGQNRSAQEFYVNETVRVCVEVFPKQVIDTIAFGAIIDSGEPISDSRIEAVGDSIIWGSKLDDKNYFSLAFHHPCSVLVAGVAHGNGVVRFDTLRVRIVEAPDSNKAPTIQLEPIRNYAAPSLPCSLKVLVQNAESWQKETLRTSNTTENISFIGTALCIYKPAKESVSGTKRISIIVTDNGNPPKSDTASVNITLLNSGEVLPPPRNLRIVERAQDFVELAWDADSLADGYIIYRNLAPNGDFSKVFETKTASFIDSVTTPYFYRIASVNFFGQSAKSSIVFACDTMNYAIAVSLLDSASTASENDSVHLVKFLGSQKTKEPISIYFSAKGLTADSNNFQPGSYVVTMKTGDSIAEVNLKIKDNGIDHETKTFILTLDSVSNGFVLGNSNHTVSIVDHDTFYSITYDKNGADSGTAPISPKRYKAAAKIVLPGNSGEMKKTGHTFSGWNTLSDGTGSAYAQDSVILMPANNLELFAQWAVTQFTIAFDTRGGGAAIAELKANYGQTLEDVLTYVFDNNVPVKLGKRFVGWYTDSLFLKQCHYAYDTVFSNTTLYAKWDSTFIVRFNSKTDAYGVEIRDGIYWTNTVNYGSKLIEPKPPKKSFYIFRGWSKDEYSCIPWDFNSDTITDNITLFATCWDPDQWTIYFDGNGNTSGTAPNAILGANHPCKAPGNTGALTKTGYLFGGWNREADGTGNNYAPDSSIWIGYSYTLFANWIPYTYTVTFDGQGATTQANPESKTVASPDTAINVLPAPPEKTGFVFGGWFTEINGGGTEFTISTAVTAPITVYAKWNN